VRMCSLGGLKTLLATVDKASWGNVNSGTGLGQNQGNGQFGGQEFKCASFGPSFKT
jgi:hypothetical protein